jgi:hypothetical protein
MACLRGARRSGFRVLLLCDGMCARHLESEITAKQLYHSVCHVVGDLLDVCLDGVIRQVWTMKGGMIGWLPVERLLAAEPAACACGILQKRRQVSDITRCMNCLLWQCQIFQPGLRTSSSNILTAKQRVDICSFTLSCCFNISVIIFSTPSCV